MNAPNAVMDTTFAGVGLAHLDFLEHALDHRPCAFEAFLFGGIRYARCVVLDVDLGTGFGLDALDVLTARADEFANAVGGNLHRHDARGMRTQFVGLGDRLGHFRQHLGAAGLAMWIGFLGIGIASRAA